MTCPDGEGTANEQGCGKRTWRNVRNSRQSFSLKPIRNPPSEPVVIAFTVRRISFCIQWWRGREGGREWVRGRLPICGSCLPPPPPPPPRRIESERLTAKFDSFWLECWRGPQTKTPFSLPLNNAIHSLLIKDNWGFIIWIHTLKIMGKKEREREKKLMFNNANTVPRFPTHDQSIELQVVNFKGGISEGWRAYAPDLIDRIFCTVPNLFVHVRVFFRNRVKVSPTCWL